MNSAQQLQDYLHRHIPLSQAMGVQVAHAEPTRVRLTAPLAPNINHRETVFGGSIASLATLAAWSVIQLGLHEEDIDARIVIQSSTLHYERAATQDFEAVAIRDDPDAWRRFLGVLGRRGRGRLALGADVLCQGEHAARLEGQFVAMRHS